MPPHMTFPPLEGKWQWCPSYLSRTYFKIFFFFFFPNCFASFCVPQPAQSMFLLFHLLHCPFSSCGSPHLALTLGESQAASVSCLGLVF